MNSGRFIDPESRNCSGIDDTDGDFVFGAVLGLLTVAAAAAGGGVAAGAACARTTAISDVVEG